MGHFIHRQRDYGLAAKMNGCAPAFFFHAEQIPGANGASVAGGSSFPCIGPAPNASQPAAPVINTTGYFGSRRCLDFASSAYLRIDDLSTLYTTMTDAFIVVAAVNIPNTAAQRTILDFGLNGSTARYADHYIDGASDQPGMYYQNSGGAVGFGASTAVTMGACTILTFARNGFQGSIFELTSSGENQLVASGSFSKTGAVSFDRGLIGAEWNNAGPTAASYFGGLMRMMAVFIRPNYANSHLTALAVHIRDKLDCPVG